MKVTRIELVTLDHANAWHHANPGAKVDTFPKWLKDYHAAWAERGLMKQGQIDTVLQ